MHEDDGVTGEAVLMLRRGFAPAHLATDNPCPPTLHATLRSAPSCADRPCQHPIVCAPPHAPQAMPLGDFRDMAREAINAAPKAEEGKEPNPDELERQVCRKPRGCLHGGLAAVWARGYHSMAWHGMAWHSMGLSWRAVALVCHERRPPAFAGLPPLQFWRNVTLNPPLYGADVPGSLFDAECKVRATDCVELAHDRCCCHHGMAWHGNAMGMARHHNGHGTAHHVATAAACITPSTHTHVPVRRRAGRCAACARC